MASKAPGKHYREGISLTKLVKMFPDDDAARKWFESKIWPDGPYCPKCGSTDVQSDIAHKTMTHRCRDCYSGKSRTMFSLKVGNIMEGSKLGYQTWAIAIYLVTTSLKGVSSMKLHRELEITQKSAWHLAHRLRKAMDEGQPLFAGPIEVDETHIGGKRKNMPKAKRRTLEGRGPVGKTTVIGAKDRASNKVTARTVETRDTETLHDFVGGVAAPGATVYTDDWRAYRGMPFHHEAVNHSAGEYVRGDAHTNGIEGCWSLLKRSYHGTFHHFSERHANLYVAEFTHRHNVREADTEDQMAALTRQSVGKRLRYRDLIADNGLDSGARG